MLKIAVNISRFIYWDFSSKKLCLTLPTFKKSNRKWFGLFSLHAFFRFFKVQCLLWVTVNRIEKIREQQTNEFFNSRSLFIDGCDFHENRKILGWFSTFGKGRPGERFIFSSKTIVTWTLTHKVHLHVIIHSFSPWKNVENFGSKIHFRFLISIPPSPHCLYYSIPPDFFVLCLFKMKKKYFH